jgi:hypothetical protein
MDIFDELLPDEGKISTAGTQQGDIFDEILPSQPAAKAATAISKGLQPTTAMEELTRPLRTIGREIYEGGKAAFAPKYSEPNWFDRLMAQTAGGAPAAAEASQKYISTPASQVMGLLRALVGGVPAAGGEELGILNQRLRSGMGLEQNPEGDLLMNLVGAAATPTSAVNLPLRAATSLTRSTLRPAMRSITQAETQGAENVMRNVRTAREAETAMAEKITTTGKAETERAAAIAAAEAKRVEAYNHLAQATAQLDIATAQVARRQGIAVTSPFGASLAAPVTNEQAYSFLKALKPGAIPSIPLTNLQKTAEEIIEQFEGIPKPLIPSKGVKTARELTGEDITTQLLGGIQVDDLTVAQKSAYAPLLETIKQHNNLGGLAIDKLQQFKQSIGELTKVTGSATLGRRLYRGLMDDLREAAKTNPGAAQALRANTIAGQNLAARDIADAVTYNGTLVDKFGRLRIQSNTLRKKLDTDELLQQLPEAKRKEVVDTLEEIFRANKRIETAEGGVATAEAGVKAATKLRVPKNIVAKQPADLPEIISPIAPKAGFVSRTLGRGIGAATGGTLGAMTGVPYGGYAGAYAGAKLGAQGADQLPQLIFQAALKPGGREFLKTMFADMPPMLGDIGKAAAISNFLMQSER